MEKFVSKKEFWMFGIGGLGQGMIYAIMSSYISDFYLNVLGVTPIFVLLLMLLARVWDAINDPLMGIIVDKTNTKRGKMKPYILITPIPVAILTVLLFFAPNISTTGKMVYAAITYTLWGMIYTMSDVPFWSLPNAMTPDAKERANVISFGRTLNGIGTAIPMAFVMILGPLLASMGLSGSGLEKTKYLTVAIFVSIIGNLLFVNVYRHSKERVMQPASKRQPGEPSPLKRIFTCKPLMLVVIMGVLSSCRYMVQAAAIHVARYSFFVGGSLEGLDAVALEKALQANISLIQLVFNVATAAGMFGTMLIMPLLFKKFNYKKILITTCLAGFVSCMIMYFIGYNNFWILVPFLVIASIPLGALNIVSYAMIGDALDYMEVKTGKRETALGSACQSFVNKLGNALTTTFIVVMYMIVGINVDKVAASNLTTNPLELSHSIRQGMFSLVTLMPGISLLLCTIPIFFYDLVGKKKQMIEDKLKEMRDEKEQAENKQEELQPTPEGA